MANDDSPEAKRLEALWSGGFGDAYVDRNWAAGEGRGPFWQKTMSLYRPRRVLEVGCNLGANLGWITNYNPDHQLYGVDVNQKALCELRLNLSSVNVVYAPARRLPFREGEFDMVFTVGVLIHQPSDTLPLVMAEIVRCSRRFILCGEYYSQEPKEVPYRGKTGALYKRDFGTLYREMFPDLRQCERGFLSRAEGWDNVTYWVFEKAQ